MYCFLRKNNLKNLLSFTLLFVPKAHNPQAIAFKRLLCGKALALVKKPILKLKDLSGLLAMRKEGVLHGWQVCA